MNEIYTEDIEILTDIDVVKNVDRKVLINENGIEQISIEILNCSKLINDYLSKILSIIDGTKNYFDCELGTIYRNKFYDFSKNFPILIQNIENYAYSLKKAESNYRDYKSVVVSKILTNSEKIDSEIRKGEKKYGMDNGWNSRKS